jgi:hypothetical protein
MEGKGFSDVGSINGRGEGVIGVKGGGNSNDEVD